MRPSRGDFDGVKLTRWRTTTTTWFRKSVALLMHFDQIENKHVQVLVHYEAYLLLDAILSEADALVPLLTHGYEADEVEERVKTLASALRKHRLADKLSQVEGRTEEETKTFLAAAERMK